MKTPLLGSITVFFLLLLSLSLPSSAQRVLECTVRIQIQIQTYAIAECHTQDICCCLIAFLSSSFQQRNSGNPDRGLQEQQLHPNSGRYILLRQHFIANIVLCNFTLNVNRFSFDFYERFFLLLLPQFVRWLLTCLTAIAFTFVYPAVDCERAQPVCYYLK